MVNVLEKGHSFNLEKADGSKINEFSIGLNWGAIKDTDGSTIDVDLDLNCIFLGINNEVCENLDWTEHTDITPDAMETDDGAVRLGGECTTGDPDGDDGLDNEVLTVNLSKVDSNVAQVFFFLNYLGENDFSEIPYVKIGIYDSELGEIKNVLGRYDVVFEKHSGYSAFIIGKLYKKESNWEFQFIGDATKDFNFLDTIERIKNSYL
ncbi:MAG: TerD family protein [Marinilabiliaceae bacterium]|nr:TerD family protein [Marinilabiliaceae bacterium]